MTILDDRDIRVRKRHQCSWCWEMIEPGERCHVQTQVDAGEICHVYTHPECVAPEHAWARVYGDDEPRIEAKPRGKSGEEDA